VVAILVLLENSLQLGELREKEKLCEGRNPCFTGKLSAMEKKWICGIITSYVAILVLLENSLQLLLKLALNAHGISRNPCFTGKLSAIKR